jgi:O-antigen ligase
MIITQKKISKLYFLLLLFCVYAPTFQVFDKGTAQYFYISLVNTLFLFLIPIYIGKIDFRKYLRHPLLITYLGFIAISALTLLVSINVVESSVRLFQMITFFIALLISKVFISKKLIKVNLVLILITISLIIDMFFSLAAYVPFVVNGIEYTYDQNTRLVGLYGNRNILATILCFKIPFVILFALRKRVKYISVIAFLIVSTAFFNISLLSSRATYLSILICSLFLILFISYILFRYRDNIKKYLKGLFLFFVPLIVALIMSNFAIDSSDEGAIVNRFSTITNTEDSSINTRLRYYSHAIEHTFKNPLLGGGIGNWKIISIKYDSANIQNYIIPYNAHNDFLEAFAETGLVGGFFFLLFFLLTPYYLYRIFQNKSSNRPNEIYFAILTLPFLVYFVDLNLNFPSSRPSNQIIFLFYLTIVLITHSKIYAKK